ncbi:PLP-dependent aminotransferase family protein [Sinorhizobium meliloti]|uniref:aminotransferase-like domain-containing protein n=1 Tax=Rhizobium meliloti TaxID=382 RepID=UPI000FDA62BA|nr:PLP-dependent aminotransferase family protein [Sinorhizobium meliloti]RVK45728.1 PLP-dependent aminotransferase family protein [Sinorhizobium meliloti]RVM82895.1 PLP-dependent aminotransferase family protein [Sinorhizobium meliloti]RVN68035.1 PLP-dependent aminotransferase family protein [Sinorhizobium meliloti]RVO29806.1 PLP-dependent aminotransferase family protein [Sinorhizobium meliloti]
MATINDTEQYGRDFKVQSANGAISLVRTTPPTPEWVGEEMKATLDRIMNQADVHHLMKRHRFGGTESDKDTAQLWLSNTFHQPPSTDRIIITNGTQSSLSMVLCYAVGRDKVLCVEGISYYGLRRIADRIGVKVVGVQMDDHGMRPDDLAEKCRKYDVGGVYLTPTIHNPLTSTMPISRRQEIVAIVEKFGTRIVEDDVYGILAEAPPAPFSSFAPESTWYCTSLAKSVAPGFKLGFLVAPTAKEAQGLFDFFKYITTWHAAPLSAELVGDWVLKGTAARAVSHVRAEAYARQTIARTALKNARFRTDPYALHLWLEVPSRYSELDFIDAAARESVQLRPGSMFYVNSDLGDAASIRVVLGSPDTRAELVDALGRIRSLL